jgi:hypothetical protein
MSAPVLYLAIPVPESFAHAEERRPFYVALTRTRREVTLITSPRRMSPFVVELLDDPHVTVPRDSDGHVEICSQCGQGTIGVRKGEPPGWALRWPKFRVTETAPAVRHTQRADLEIRDKDGL